MLRRRHGKCAGWWLAILSLALGCNCNKPPTSTAPGTLCPTRLDAPDPVPSVRKSQLQAAYWIKQLQLKTDIDRPIWSTAKISAHRQYLEEKNMLFDLRKAVDAEWVKGFIRRRLSFLRSQLQEKKYIKSLRSERLVETPQSLVLLSPQIRVALKEFPLLCGPIRTKLIQPGDRDKHDRNRCGQVRMQEPVQVLVSWGGGLALARTSYAMGWIDQSAALSEPIAKHMQQRWQRGPFITKHRPHKNLHWRVPLDPDAKQSWEMTPTELVTKDHSAPPDSFTLRQVLIEAFQYVGQPYGWGGEQGGRDCSRFILDVLGNFGVPMPRTSHDQKRVGTFRIPVSRGSDMEKLAILNEAIQHGIVLLHLPGHIMLYLGTSADGHPYAIHSLWQYALPCDQRHETVFQVRKVTVTPLSLGEGSKRGSLLQRIDEITVIGDGPSPKLQGLAQLRAAVAPQRTTRCQPTSPYGIFVSPLYPSNTNTLTVIATRHEGSARPQRLWLWDPDGNLQSHPDRQVDGPPFASLQRIDKPAAGRWTAMLADGSDVRACQYIKVRAGRDPPPQSHTQDVPWPFLQSWHPDIEDFFSIFVQQLFWTDDHQQTWTDLGKVLEDPERNLLHNHLGQREDDQWRLQPDCADLPYTLRAYFSWKLRLPFAFRRCSRGNNHSPPSCGPVVVARDMAPSSNPFLHYFRRYLASGVHSGNGRTSPSDDATDYYPIALSRTTLRPGTVFADSEGHIMMLSRWIPQTLGGFGQLIAVDAQPDATVGQQIFGRGSFLFDPDTQRVGAGFKAFRPFVFDSESQKLSQTTNEALTDHAITWRKPDMGHYALSKDDFYEAMDSLINPLPMHAEATLQALIEAYDAAVQRRQVSVLNATNFVKEHPSKTISMPRGYAIFETKGEWEDYSTPSRDMRLLILMDEVDSLLDRIRDKPERFGMKAQDLEDALPELKKQWKTMLQGRSIEYQDSGAKPQRVSLWTLLQHKKAFESAYNPNDCIEVRWGLSDLGSCKRRAPEEQQQRMQEYSDWFKERRRPPR